MNKKNYNLGFSLIEVLLVVTLFVIILSSAISLVSSKTAREDLDAKARQILSIVSTARDYSVAGFQQDVWGIKILDNDALCEDNGDCIVLFKSRDWASRDSAYDRIVNFDTGVYIEADQENEFYFEYLSGWSSVNYDIAIVLRSNGIDENKIIVIEPTGMAYIQGQEVFGESLVVSQAAEFSMGTFSDVELSGNTIKLTSVVSEGYDNYPWQLAYDSYTNSVWVVNGTDNSISKVNQSGRKLGTYSITATVGQYQGIVFDSHTNSIWVASDGSDTGYVTKVDVSDGTILGTYELDEYPTELVFDSYTNSIWVRRYDATSNSLFKVNVNTGTSSEYAIGIMGSVDGGIAFDSVNNTIWIAYQDDLYEYSVVDGSLQNSYLNYTASDGVCTFYDLIFESQTNSIWASDNCNDIVYKISNTDGNVTASTSIADLHDIAFDSTDNQIFAMNRFGTLSRLNISTGVVEATSDTNQTAGVTPGEILYNSLGDNIWWANPTQISFIQYDTDSSSTFLQYDLYNSCDFPKGISHDSSRDNIWVACSNDGVVHKINPSDGTVLSTTTISGAAEVIYDSVNDKIWAIGLATSLFEIDPSDGAISNTITLTTFPRDLTYDSQTNSVWVGLSNGTIDKVNASSGALTGNYSTEGGTNVYGVAFDDYTDTIWAVNNSNQVYAKINVADGSLAASSTLTSANPFLALVNQYNNNIWLGGASIDIVDSGTATILENPANLNSICSSCRNGAYDPINNSIWLADYVIGVGGFSHVSASDYSSIGEYYIGDYAYDITYDSTAEAMWGTISYQDKLVKMPVRGYSSSGDYISHILDTLNNSEFGTISWSVSSPSGTSLTMKVRTATSSDMSGATDWDSCDSVTNGLDISSNNCVTDGERYVQYRAYFTTSDDGASPSLDSVTILYNNN